MSNGRPNGDVVVSAVERGIRAMFCREPEASVIFNAPAEDILDPSVRAVVQAAQELRRKRYVPTPARLALALGVEVGQIEDWGAEVGPQIRADFHTYGEIVSAASQQRRLVTFLGQAQQRAMNASLLEMESLVADIRTQMTMISRGSLRRYPVYAWEIMEELEGITEAMRVFPTGIPIMDAVLRGGVRPYTFHILAGAMKQGKTTAGRNIGWNMLHTTIFDDQDDGTTIERPIRVVHVALDGGNRIQHMADYWAMETKHRCLQLGITTEVRLDNGAVLDCVTSENLLSYQLGLNKRDPSLLQIPIPPQVVEQIEQARLFFKGLREAGYFVIFDMESMGNDLEQVFLLLEQYVVLDHYDVIIFDHAGKVGDRKKSREIYQRLDEFALEMASFLTSRPVAGIIISQRNKKGIEQHSNKNLSGTSQDEDYDPQLEGGNPLAKECDSLWFAGKPTDESLKLWLHFLRRGKSKKVKPAIYGMHGYSGLLDYEWKGM